MIACPFEECSGNQWCPHAVQVALATDRVGTRGEMVMQSGLQRSGDAPHRLGTPNTEAQMRNGSKQKDYIIQNNRQICTPVYPTPRIQNNQPN